LDSPEHVAGLKPFEISQNYSIDLLSLISSMLSEDPVDRPTAANVKSQLMVLIRKNISPSAQECYKCGNVFLSNTQLRKHMKAVHRPIIGSVDFKSGKGQAPKFSEDPTPDIWIEDRLEFDNGSMTIQPLADGTAHGTVDPSPCLVCMRNFNSKKRFFQHLHCQNHWRNEYYVLKRRSENEININNSKRKRF
jgi:hypothetical protein